MSTRTDLDKEREQREWEAQEIALRAERGGESAGGDTRVAQYRLIARALRNQRFDPWPSDFAARTAAHVALEARMPSEGVEVWLERALVTLLVLAGAVAVLVYNGETLRELSFTLPEPTALGLRTVMSWGAAVAACVGVSWAFELLRKR